MLLRPALTACLLVALPFVAAAQVGPCAPMADDQARLNCDLARAAAIAADGERLFGRAETEWLRIVDTESPSGSAYIYYLIDEAPYLLLEARAVPQGGNNGRSPACRLRTTMPLDTAEQVRSAAAAILAEPPPSLGPREAVTVNPDGSRSIRLILDSRDIITRITGQDASYNFSRLEGADDAITRLNNLVIGIANFSSDWNCNTP